MRYVYHNHCNLSIGAFYEFVVVWGSARTSIESASSEVGSVGLMDYEWSSCYVVEFHPVPQFETKRTYSKLLHTAGLAQISIQLLRITL